MSTDPCRSRPSRQGSARPHGRSWLAAALMMLFAGAALAQEQAAGEPERDPEGDIVFLHALDNQPIEFDLRPDQAITLAVEQFHKTAENPYSGELPRPRRARRSTRSSAKPATSRTAPAGSARAW